MAKQVTLNALENRVRYLTNKANASNNISSLELQNWLNTDLDLLYSKIAALDPDRYLINTAIGLTQGISNYSLPADFLMLKGIDCQISNNSWIELKSMNWEDRNQTNNGNIYDLRYHVRGSELVLVPAPSANVTLRFWYVPTRADITSVGTFDGINGWEEWAILSSAIRVRQKENTSALEFERARDRIEKLIIDPLASNRDLGSPSRIRDVLGHFNIFKE